MKNFLLALSFITLSLSGFNQTTLIPDANFEQALINLGYDVGSPDGSVPTANINSIGFLDVNSKNISDLTGIGDFSSLVILFAQNNNLSSINLLQNTSLTTLRVDNNQLTNLDVTMLSNLNDLNCSNNQLTNLDVTQNINLTSLTCSNNQLSHLNITNNPSISYLVCHMNNIELIDVSSQPNLATLNCQNNNLLRLDVTNNTLLKYLWCSGNNITSIDVSQNPVLKDLYCSNNMLSCLNVRNGNNNSLVNFNSTSNPSLTCINVDSINYAQTNWTNIDAGAFFDTNCVNNCILPPCSLVANFIFTDNGNGNFSFQDFSTINNDSIVSWFWEFGNGDTSSSQNPNYNYILNKAYKVNLTVTTNNLCVGYFSQNLNVTSVLCGTNAGFSYINNGSNNVSFTDTSTLIGTPPFSYLWNFTLDTTSVQNPNYTYDFNGDWLATLTVTDSLGCSDSTTQLISVNSLPCNATFSYVDNGNGNYSFSSSPTGVSPFGYMWNFDDGNTAQFPNPNHTFTSNGTYAVGLLTQDSNFCETLDFDTIIVTNIGCNSFTPNFSYVDNGGGNYSFTNTTTGNFILSDWSFGDGNTSTQTSPTHTFTANGLYTIVLAISDSLTNACVDYYTQTINVTGVPNPPACNAGFVIYADSISNNFIVVNSSIGNNLTFFWDFGDGNTSTQPFPNYTYSTPGPFNLCLTVDDGVNCTDMFCDSIGSNGVVFKQSGFTINVVAPTTSTGIRNETELNSTITVYPNPTSAELLVSTNLKINKVCILDMSGKTIKSAKLDMNSINVSELNSGIYFIKVITDEKVIIKKFIKK